MPYTHDSWPPSPLSEAPAADDQPEPRPSPHASPYPLSRLAPPFALVDVAREIELADQMLGATVGNKLELLAEQIRALQAKARDVLAAAERDAKLHRARCNFRKRPGFVYHLYRAADESLYFSMLSPADWCGAAPDAFVASYRLELDASFTEVGARER